MTKKNKQVSNKPVPHKPTRPSKSDIKVENDNAILHKTFYETHRKELYEPKGFLLSGSKVKPPTTTNLELSKQWHCTVRHASKVKNGGGEPVCMPGCGCPNAVKAAAQAQAAQQPAA